MVHRAGGAPVQPAIVRGDTVVLVGASDLAKPMCRRTGWHAVGRHRERRGTSVLAGGGPRKSRLRMRCAAAVTKTTAGTAMPVRDEPHHVSDQRGEHERGARGRLRHDPGGGARLLLADDRALDREHGAEPERRRAQPQEGARHLTRQGIGRDGRVGEHDHGRDAVEHRDPEQRLDPPQAGPPPLAELLAQQGAHDGELAGPSDGGQRQCGRGSVHRGAHRRSPSTSARKTSSRLDCLRPNAVTTSPPASTTGSSPSAVA